MCLTSFGDDSTEPLALPPCRDNAMVDKDAAASNPCLSLVEMRTSTAAGGLLSAGTAFTSLRSVVFQPLFFWTLGEKTKERTSQTNNNKLAPPYWKNVIQMKSRQTLVFDPGGCTGRLRDYSFLGGRYALRIGWARLN